MTFNNIYCMLEDVLRIVDYQTSIITLFNFPDNVKLYQS